MAKKEAESPGEAMKDGHGYRVVWEEEEEVGSDEEKEPLVLWSRDSSRSPDSRRTPAHVPYPRALAVILAVIAFLALFLLVFISPTAFWICSFLLMAAFAVMLFMRKSRRAYVDRMQQNVVYLKIKNPILTGFEIALGIGLFGAICMLVGIAILLVFAVAAGYGLWSLVSGLI